MDVKSIGHSLINILQASFDKQKALDAAKVEILKPLLSDIMLKVQSGEIDLVKGTDMDKAAVLAVLVGLQKALGL